MPYRTIGGKSFERARSTAHSPIVDNPFVQERLSGYRIFTPPTNPVIESSLLVPVGQLSTTGDHRRWVMSFDGSPNEVSANDQFPSTRVGYVQVAGVLVDVDTMLAEGKHQFVDPAVIRKATQESLLPLVMAGSNVLRDDMDNVRDSWRADVYETFRDYRIEDMSLLDILFALLPHSDKWAPGGGVVLYECSAHATPDCTQTDITVGKTPTPCPQCGEMLFPTDALRFHEEVLEEHSNLTALGRLMSTLEVIVMVGYLHFLHRRRPAALGNLAFVMDGPLAIFGPQAWLRVAVRKLIWAQREELAAQNIRPPIIVGIEKDGAFPEYGNAVREAIPPGHLMILPDDYIFRHIVPSRQRPKHRYGHETYYGQKFFYRTKNGQLLTITVPALNTPVADPENANHYPLLGETLALLDRIGTSLYQDANIPVALAHSYASIPLKTGSKVLTLLTRDLIGAGQP